MIEIPKQVRFDLIMKEGFSTKINELSDEDLSIYMAMNMPKDATTLERYIENYRPYINDYNFNIYASNLFPEYLINKYLDKLDLTLLTFRNAIYSRNFAIKLYSQFVLQNNTYKIYDLFRKHQHTTYFAVPKYILHRIHLDNIVEIIYDYLSELLKRKEFPWHIKEDLRINLKFRESKTYDITEVILEIYQGDYFITSVRLNVNESENDNLTFFDMNYFEYKFKTPLHNSWNDLPHNNIQLYLEELIVLELNRINWRDIYVNRKSDFI